MSEVLATPSPCISVCLMDEASGWCCGCLRTLEEIASWSAMTEDAKRAVWDELPGRRIALHGPRAAMALPDWAR